MPSNTSRANRERRQREAAARQEEYELLPLQDKIDKAYNMPGESKRELTRLNKIAEGLGWKPTPVSEPVDA